MQLMIQLQNGYRRRRTAPRLTCYISRWLKICAAVWLSVR